MKSYLLLIVMLAAGLAQADWGPDPELSSAWLEYAGPGPVSLLVLPDGSGRAFTEAQTMGDSQVDATVHLQIFDWGGNPIQGYPTEDIWLEAADGGLIPCAQGTCADAPTDENGMTFWSSPLHAGGSSDDLCLVVVNGSPLTFSGLPLQFNSPDLTGDLVVNLSDVSLFTQDFYGLYNYRSDFSFDGALNLSDLSALAQGLGAACP